MIYEILFIGEDKPRTAKEIAAQLHCDQRQVSRMIEHERRNGKAICATSNGGAPGYYIAKTQEELQRYCARLLHRMGQIAKTRRALQAIDNITKDAGGQYNG